MATSPAMPTNTPFTYLIVNFLKKAEDEDYFDRGTDFTPFSLQD